MPQNYQPMTEAQYHALMNKVQDGSMGDETVYACTVQPYDHLHVRRLGDEQGGADSRVGVMIHTVQGALATLFFSASDARSIAETLLSEAESIDGVSMAYDVPDDLTALLPPEDSDE